MILTDKKIRDMVVNFKDYNLEKPLIENFKEENLESVTYDITITKTIHIMKRAKIIDLKDKDSIDNLYEKKDMDSTGYIILPGEYILVGVEEGMNLPDDVIAEILPKTRLTRAGLILSLQYCNPSYSGFLQLGLKNVSQNPIIIYPKTKVGQYLFIKLEEKPTIEKLYRNKKNAAYQNEAHGEFRGTEIENLAIEKLNEIFKKKI